MPQDYSFDQVFRFAIARLQRVSVRQQKEQQTKHQKEPSLI